MNDKVEKIERMPFSINAGIEILANLRNGLDMPLMTPEYQVLSYAISLFRSVKFTKPIPSEKRREKVDELICEIIHNLEGMYRIKLMDKNLLDHIRRTTDQLLALFAKPALLSNER